MNTALPPQYSKWMRDVIPGEMPDETRATCSECVMCSVDSVVPFEARTKCCTYIPTIPNFLTGKILEKEISVFEMYFKRANVTPLGVSPNKEFIAQYNPSSSLFGRNLDWRCPYYLEEQGGLCGIWEHRNSRCATWFCKHLRGQISREFWSAIDRLLTEVERALTCYCIHQLEAGSVEFRQAFPVETQEARFGIWIRQQSFQSKKWLGQDPDWGRWLDRKKEFFQECHRLIDRLDWKDVQSICGPGLQPLEQEVLLAYEKLRSDFFPEILQLGDFQQSEGSGDEVRVWTSNPYDPVVLTKTALRILHRMNGKKMDHVALVVPQKLLKQLFDAGVIL